MQVFDLILALGALGCALAALTARDRIASVAAFVIMGMLVALCWVRLGATDVALAEAAIGAGLTGAMLLRSAWRIAPLRTRSVPALASGLAALLAIILSLGLVWALSSASSRAVYPSLVSEHLEDSGVGNPVTAVLLNFRAWDTLLEVAVLVVALLMAASLSSDRIRIVPLGPLMLPFARIVTPVTILLAGHLLWGGASAPGGAFQAAAVLAGAVLVLVLGGFATAKGRVLHAMRLIGLSGLTLFLAAGLWTEVTTGALLEYPHGEAKIWILAIESALTPSIAAMLVLLFVGPERRRQE